MNDFSVWSLMIDLSIFSGLLLVGIMLRAKVKWIQSVFLPASIIAGFLGLALGKNGLNMLPFSNQLSVYPSVLITIIFAAIPLGSTKVQFKTILHRVREMWSYSMLLTVFMWGGGAIFSLIFINQIFTDLPSGFGLILGAGFLGGHGTAAAIGEGFRKYGWIEATSLGMTAATIGILVAILGGLFLVKRNIELGQTAFISNYKDLPIELKSGLIHPNNRTSMGVETVHPNSIDPLVLHISIISFIVGIAFWVTNSLTHIFNSITVPLFSVAFLVSLLMQISMRKIKVDSFVDRRVIERISGSATDYLVAVGIASINITVVYDYAIPLCILLAFGVVWAYLIFRIIGPKIFKNFWFEKSIFGWGWSTGTVAIGIALLRIVDPELKSKTIDDYALAYIGMVPIEITIITFAPILVSVGQPWLMPIALMLLGIIIILVHKYFGIWG